MANTLPELTTEQVKKLDRMCPVAGDVDLGTLLAAIMAMLEAHETTLADHETRISALEGA